MNTHFPSVESTLQQQQQWQPKCWPSMISLFFLCKCQPKQLNVKDTFLKKSTENLSTNFLFDQSPVLLAHFFHRLQLVVCRLEARRQIVNLKEKVKQIEIGDLGDFMNSNLSGKKKQARIHIFRQKAHDKMK